MLPSAPATQAESDGVPESASPAVGGPLTDATQANQLGTERKAVPAVGSNSRVRLSEWTAAITYRLRARIFRRRGPVPRPIELLRQRFDPDWYTNFYGLHPLSPQRSPFDHYLSLGSTLGFSPGPDFDEGAYRTANRDVAAAIKRGEVLCGYEHFVLYGRSERRVSYHVDDHAPGSSDNPLHSPLAFAVREDFDPQWYIDHYPDVGRDVRAGTLASPLYHYVTVGVAKGLSPNASFDERWYLECYPDIDDAKASGLIPNGFFHYLLQGRSEGRLAKPDQVRPEKSTTGLSYPVGVARLADLERKLSPFPFRVFPRRHEPRVNFLLPTLDKHLMFGGYIAALNFLNRLQDRGWLTRLLITDDVRSSAEGLRNQFSEDPLATSVLERAEVVNLTRRSQVLDIAPNDSFIAYSMWAAHHAAILAAAVGRRFTFFVQEFEPAFHHHDSWHAIGASIYNSPHFALFNSELLRRYFARERIGVYRDGDAAGKANSAVFEHALSVPTSPAGNELERNGTRRLLFYARPEAHAGRNLFEVGAMAIRRASADGVFDDAEWSFEGIGTLTTDTAVQLGRGHVLKLKPRLKLNDYSRMLRRFEVGLSLQYAPHPGVVAFEMAASGMVVVTNTFANRDEADLRAISPNLVPVQPTPDAIAAGLAQAAQQARDLAACVRGADQPWVTSWKQSFNDDLMARIEAELRGSSASIAAN